MNAEIATASVLAIAMVRNTLEFKAESKPWICVVLVESSIYEAADFNRDFGELSSKAAKIGAICVICGSLLSMFLNSDG